MSIEGNLKVDSYINEVCSLIKNKKVHTSIREELLCHIEEITEDYISQGESYETSIDKALAKMGSAEIVGVNLNKVHKANVDWPLLLLTSAFVLFGIFILSFMDKNNILSEIYSNSLSKTIVYATIGALLLFVILKINYRNIKKYSKHIYIGTILASILTIFFSSHINGAMGWIIIGPISFNIFNIAPFPLIIALAGIFENWNWTNKKNLLIGSILAFAPTIIFCYGHTLSNASIYFIAAITVMLISGVKLKHIILSIVPFTVLFAGFIFTEPYRVSRLLIFLNPYKYPECAGWMYTRLNSLRESAGLFGNGATFTPDMLPEFHSDFILTYIMYTFGWTTTLIIIALVLAFIIRIGFIVTNTKDIFGKILVSGFCSIFAVQFLLNILMNFSLSPIAGVGLPFISYGGSSLIINILSIGLISNVYKWRNTPLLSEK